MNDRQLRPASEKSGHHWTIAWLLLIIVSRAPYALAQENAPTVREPTTSQPVENKLGKSDADPLTVAGRLLDVSGKPTADAIVHVRHTPADVDTTATTDGNGEFTIEIRLAESARQGLKIAAHSSDGSSMAFYRATSGGPTPGVDAIELRLEPTKLANVLVVDTSDRPIADANVALQLSYPNTLGPLLTDVQGRATFQLPDTESVESLVAWKDHLGLDYKLYTLLRGQQSDKLTKKPEFPFDSVETLKLEGKLIYLTLHGIDLNAMGKGILPNPESSNRWVSPMRQLNAQSKKDGSFEFFIGPSDYNLFIQGFDAEKVSIDDELEKHVDLRILVQQKQLLTGLVISAETNDPIEGVFIEAVSRNFRQHNDWKATTTKDGKFQVDRFGEATYLHATSEDTKLGAILEIAATETAVVLQLKQVGIATGRLMSRDGSEPAVGVNRQWEKDYVWVKMDHRWTGAREIMQEIRDGAEGGIPWFAILDSDGEKLTTSNLPDSGQNIGFPSEVSGQKHFAEMLQSTSQRMTAQEIQDLAAAAGKN